MKKPILLLFYLLLATYLLGQSYTPVSSGEYIQHAYYSLAYDEDHEQAKWVYYELTPASVSGAVSRTDDFRPDPKVSTSSAQLIDYKGSGYDRGHLAPAGSMTQSRQSMSESFFMSNMSPQDPSFNRGIWQQLESGVRNWVSEKGHLYVVTGPVFKDNIGRIGVNQVTVPGYYYKIVYSPSDQQMIAFLLPNKKGENALDYYVVSVDSIEALTGIDFFSQMDDTLEDQLEAGVSLSAWTISTTRPSSSSSSSAKSQTESGQCQGIAKSTGVQCRNKTTNENGFCYLHQDQEGNKQNTTIKQSPPAKASPAATSGRCAATTQAGTRCKRTSASGSRYCWQHK
jgi:endonuclease G